MDFYILIFHQDTQYIVFGALLYVFTFVFSFDNHYNNPKNPVMIVDAMVLKLLYY